MRIAGRYVPPPDKSITHRALILAALAEGVSEVENPLDSGDTRATLACLRRLGAQVQTNGRAWKVTGRGLSLSEPEEPLNAGNSGTTMRLLCGVAAGQKFETVLIGDRSLSRRPMKRVIAPLKRMGARIEAERGNYPPLRIRGPSGGRLRPIRYELPIPSAQVKSCLLFAGLYADGPTRIREKIPSRDHTERLLPIAGGKIQVRRGLISAWPAERLRSFRLAVPGDLSSAAFFLAAAVGLPGSRLTVEGVGLNPTRTGFLRVLKRMGAEVEVRMRTQDPEPEGMLVVSSGPLKAFRISGEEVPLLIDEIPLLAVLASRATGVSRIEGAQELRFKESDRIAAIVAGLRALGAKAREFADGLEVEGPVRLKAGVVDSRGDHRIAMAFAIAGLWAEGTVRVKGMESAEISYPNFERDLKCLLA